VLNNYVFKPELKDEILFSLVYYKQTNCTKICFHYATGHNFFCQFVSFSQKLSYIIGRDFKSRVRFCKEEISKCFPRCAAPCSPASTTSTSSRRSDLTSTSWFRSGVNFTNMLTACFYTHISQKRKN